MASTYKIDFNDGTSNPGNNPVEVARDTRDTTSVDVTLFGRGTFAYGEELNENLLHLLEHFASAEATRPTATTHQEQRDAVSNIQPNTSNWAIRQPTPGQLWANKTTEHLQMYLKSINKWDNLLNSGDVTVNWGTIVDGATIPLPVSATGHIYTEAECAWIIAPAAYGDNIAYMRVAADTRLVAARVSTVGGEAPTGQTPITVNYMIIGVRDNVNSADATSSTTSGATSLTINTTSVAISGLINSPLTGSLSLTVIDSSGALVSPADLTFVWYRITDGGDVACSTVQYDAPVRQSTTDNLFTFTATSQFVLLCNPSWRVVATDSAGNRGQSTVQLVFNFESPQNALVVSTGSISYAAAETNAPAEAVVSATISGGTAPYTVVWSTTAIDGSGAILTTQDPPIAPPASPVGTSLLTDATYSLQRSTAQTVFTRVSVTVTDAHSRQARAFTTIRYNFVETGDTSTSPQITPLQMSIDGTLEGVYTIESSAYTQASAGADSRVFTLTIPVSVLNVAEGTQLAITRLRDTDHVQFNLISPAIIPNATSGSFVFSISGTTASNYPGTNSDAWRITFTGQDGRVISRDVITKFNYLTTQRPLTATVASTTVTAQATYEPTPAPTFVTLQAAPAGGIGPFTYLWNVSAITSAAPFTVVGPLNRPTLTLQLRGTTFNHPEFGDVVWPAPTPGNLNYAYSVAVSVTVRDSSLPSQQVVANATAAIKFTVDDQDMAVAPSYNQLVTDFTYNKTEPYTMKGKWICNPSFVTPTNPYPYETYNRVSLDVIRGSGAYSYTWVEETRAAASTLTPVIVFPDTTAYNKSVYFKAAQTNCVAGTRFYEGVWRCDIVDLHTGVALVHRDVVRIEACAAAMGTIDDTIQRAPYGVGFNCA